MSWENREKGGRREGGTKIWETPSKLGSEGGRAGRGGVGRC